MPIYPVGWSATKCQLGHISYSLILPFLEIFFFNRLNQNTPCRSACTPPLPPHHLPSESTGTRLSSWLFTMETGLWLLIAASYLFQIRPLWKSNLVSFFCFWNFENSELLEMHVKLFCLLYLDWFFFKCPNTITHPFSQALNTQKKWLPVSHRPSRQLQCPFPTDWKPAKVILLLLISYCLGFCEVTDVSVLILIKLHSCKKQQGSSQLGCHIGSL